MESWSRLTHQLAELAFAAPPPPAQGRVGAALALLRPVEHDLEIVYTKRRDDLPTHPGQISFPGGRVDRGESIEEAALREAAEECGLRRESVTVLGTLPAFYIPPSRFWLQVVVARWDDPHPLTPAEAEVAEILAVRLSVLRDPARWCRVTLSAGGSSWAWELDGGHLLWGATAIATALLLGMLDPDWSDGRAPQDLPPDRERQPWKAGPPGAPVRAARLPGVPEVDARSVSPLPAGVEAADVAAPAGEGVAAAVAALLPAGGRILVLAGPGWTGTVGLLAAAVLDERGSDVSAMVLGEPRLPAAARSHAVERLGARVLPVTDPLPPADLIVDAVVGRGLDGPLRGAPLDAVLSLRATATPIVSVDLPSGVHPERGLLGDAVAADVTLALGAPALGLFAAGITPFVGDLYLVSVESPEAEAADPLVRVVPAAGTRGWSE